jgi:propanol-preferring alcohol dehydrogenase
MPADEMRAALLTAFGEKLQIGSAPKPVAGPGEVVFRTEACGLCHTDIHTAYGELRFKPKLPLILGHEAVGVVEEVGEGVTHISKGDRVCLPWLAYACGDCDLCVTGMEPYCEKQLNAGLNIDGGYAQYAKVNARYAGIVPAKLDPFEAAVLSCAGLTTYKAVKVSGAGSADLVAIFGVGGLGHLAIQYARIRGASVVAIDLQDSKLELAKQLGAEHVINAAKVDAAKAIRELGGAKAAIVLVANQKACEQAYHCLKRGGTMVLVGLSNATFEVPILLTIAKGITIRGSIVGNRVDLRETYDLHMQGKTRVLFEKRKLEEVNEAFQEVKRGNNKSPRIVLDLN